MSACRYPFRLQTSDPEDPSSSIISHSKFNLVTDPQCDPLQQHKPHYLPGIFSAFGGAAQLSSILMWSLSCYTLPGLKRSHHPNSSKQASGQSSGSICSLCKDFQSFQWLLLAVEILFLYLFFVISCMQTDVH